MRREARRAAKAAKQAQAAEMEMAAQQAAMEPAAKKAKTSHPAGGSRSRPSMVSLLKARDVLTFRRYAFFIRDATITPQEDMDRAVPGGAGTERAEIASSSAAKAAKQARAAEMEMAAQQAAMSPVARMAKTNPPAGGGRSRPSMVSLLKALLKARNLLAFSLRYASFVRDATITPQDMDLAVPGGAGTERASNPAAGTEVRWGCVQSTLK